MRNIPIASFDFGFFRVENTNDSSDEDFVLNVRFDGKIQPIVNGKRVESKMEICRFAICVLRQFGYVVGTFGKPTPTLYIHYRTQSYSDLTYSLFIVCSFVNLLPYNFDWDCVLFNGLRFVERDSSDSYCVVALCSDYKNSRHIHVSSVCLIDNSLSVVKEYLSYNIKDSYILISH